MKIFGTILLVFVVIFSLSGCDYISTAICLVSNSKDKCVEKLFLSDEKNRKLMKGEIVFGDSSLYELTIPSDRWLKLPTAKNKKFPNRDMRLVHGSGGSYLDVDSKSSSDLAAKKIAHNYVTELGESFKGELEEIPTDKWDNITVDNALLRLCFEVKNKGSGCFYTLVLKTESNEVIFHGTAALTEELINDYESILLSIKVSDNK